MKDFVVNGKVINITLENGKVVKAATAFIENMMKTLDLDMEDAVLTWLEDEEFLINEEQEELDAEAKKNKSKLVVNDKVKEPKEKKPRERKANPVKEKLIADMAAALETMGAESIVVENIGKLITFKIDGRDFKLDLIEKRQPKEK